MNNSIKLEALKPYKYLAVDSRAVFDAAHTVFAAIRTDIGDGHRYIAPLYEKGVRAFIVENRPDGDFAEATFFTVENVPATLAEIARQRLEGVNSGIIVTGSIGKTTVKELLYTALLEHRVRRSPRSWNSSIGIPLAVWEMTAENTNANHYITEVGIDGPGQSAPIVNILGNSHHIAIITPITDEHDEAFDSHSTKIREKVALVDHCQTIVYADTDAELSRQLNELKAKRTELALHAVSQGEFASIYHALVDKALDVLGYDDKIRHTAASLPTVNKRREIANGSYGNTIYSDHFTADKRSLQAALDFMRRHATPNRTKVLFVGTMLDCGSTEASELASQFGIDRVEVISDSLLATIHSGREFRDMQILLFGESDALKRKVAEALESAGHETTLEVDLDAIIHNYNHYRSLVPAETGIVAMVKASAYGMGSIEIGKALQSVGAAYLAVAVIEEGIALREAGITMPIMVLNPVTNRYPALFAHRLEPAVFSADELDRLIAEANAYGVSNYPVHIKLDTGMHRVGFTEMQLSEIPDRISRASAVRVASAFSHLATADCLDMDEYTTEQLNRFKAMTTKLRQDIGYTFRRHILNTAGMMRFANFGEYEMARLGIGLYGLSPYPGPDGDALQPVATFRSHIISIKHWDKGTAIGYSRKGITVSDDSIIATIPVGYADGVNRRLGNGNTSFVINGVECPTIGNICMDLCMVDITAVPEAKVGDKVEIFGPHMSVERLADTLGTISYEVLTSVAPRVKRVYIKR